MRESADVEYVVLVSRPSLDAFRAILQSSPALRSLEILEGSPKRSDLRRSFSKGAGRPIPIPLLELAELRIGHVNCPEYLANILRLFDMPNLTTLSLHHLEYDEEYNSEIFDEPLKLLTNHEQFAGLRNSLQFLKFWRIGFSEPSVLERLLFRLPNLRSLHVRHSWDPDDGPARHDIPSHYLRALFPPAAREEEGLPPAPVPVACPLLEELCALRFDKEAIVRFVRHRNEAGAPIQRLLMGKDDEWSNWQELQLMIMGVETFHATTKESEESEDGDDDDDDEIGEGEDDNDGEGRTDGEDGDESQEEVGSEDGSEGDSEEVGDQDEPGDRD